MRRSPTRSRAYRPLHADIPLFAAQRIDGIRYRVAAAVIGSANAGRRRCSRPIQMLGHWAEVAETRAFSAGISLTTSSFTTTSIALSIAVPQTSPSPCAACVSQCRKQRASRFTGSHKCQPAARIREYPDCRPRAAAPPSIVRRRSDAEGTGERFQRYAAISAKGAGVKA